MAEVSMHTDAEDVGYGGTLKLEEMSEGRDGMIRDQGILSWKEIVSSITYRELRGFGY